MGINDIIVTICLIVVVLGILSIIGVIIYLKGYKDGMKDCGAIIQKTEHIITIPNIPAPWFAPCIIFTGWMFMDYFGLTPSVPFCFLLTMVIALTDAEYLSHNKL